MNFSNYCDRFEKEDEKFYLNKKENNMHTSFEELLSNIKKRIALEKMAQELKEDIATAVESGELSQSTANELKPKLVLIKGGKYE